MELKSPFRLSRMFESFEGPQSLNEAGGFKVGGTASAFYAFAKKLLEPEGVKIEMKFREPKRKDGDAVPYIVITVPAQDAYEWWTSGTGLPQKKMYDFQGLLQRFQVDYPKNWPNGSSFIVESFKEIKEASAGSVVGGILYSKMMTGNSSQYYDKIASMRPGQRFEIVATPPADGVFQIIARPGTATGGRPFSLVVSPNENSMYPVGMLYLDDTIPSPESDGWTLVPDRGLTLFGGFIPQDTSLAKIMNRIVRDGMARNGEWNGKTVMGIE